MPTLTTVVTWNVKYELMIQFGVHIISKTGVTGAPNGHSETTISALSCLGGASSC